MKVKGFNFSVNEISGRTFELPYNKAIDFIKSNCPDKNIDFDNIEEYELAELLWNYCYEDIEKYANVTVVISRCKKCGNIEMSWIRQENTEELEV